jgi:hypothetical protein
MVDVGQHLLAVGRCSDRVFKARLGAEAASAVEAGRNGAPKFTSSPLERVTLAVAAYLGCLTTKFTTDQPAPVRIATRSAQSLPPPRAAFPDSVISPSLM